MVAEQRPAGNNNNQARAERALVRRQVAAREQVPGQVPEAHTQREPVHMPPAAEEPNKHLHTPVRSTNNGPANRLADTSSDAIRAHSPPLRAAGHNNRIRILLR